MVIELFTTGCISSNTNAATEDSNRVIFICPLLTQHIVDHLLLSFRDNLASHEVHKWYIARSYGNICLELTYPVSLLALDSKEIVLSSLDGLTYSRDVHRYEWHRLYNPADCCLRLPLKLVHKKNRS